LLFEGSFIELLQTKAEIIKQVKSLSKLPNKIQICRWDCVYLQTKCSG
jgi:hypothetical protein